MDEGSRDSHGSENIVEYVEGNEKRDANAVKHVATNKCLMLREIIRLETATAIWPTICKQHALYAMPRIHYGCKYDLTNNNSSSCLYKQ
ncbi:unnamed protein product [Onchocerca flexuosa]|uniref:Uncharacterized protein n=1 Tax=Onchocerca flexuosa TaxID=387005 RepID=A0A183HET3_9BILA|nr:unnamed protein product [Onchocerca flexuosa]